MSKSNTWVKNCIDYWELKLDEVYLGVNWADAEDRCWRCGCQRHLQKCHIISKGSGGKNTPGNTIALCCQCHDEAPDVFFKEGIFNWIYDTRVVCYDVYWFYEAIVMADIIWPTKLDSKKLQRAFSEVEYHKSQTGKFVGCKTSSIAVNLRREFPKAKSLREYVQEEYARTKPGYPLITFGLSWKMQRNFGLPNREIRSVSFYGGSN